LTHPASAISSAEEKSERAKPKQAEIVAVNFAAAASLTAGLVTAHPKPAKRLNAKERAKARIEANADAKDGIGPDTRAKTKSKAEVNAKIRSKAKAKSKSKLKMKIGYKKTGR
jgi:hypothetical protein